VFQEWRDSESGSLLLIYGNGKFLLLLLSFATINIFSNSQLVRVKVFFGTQLSVCFCDRELIFSLSSAIIEDIWNKQGAGSAMVAYYYFDHNDSSKRDIRGLLISLLFQLSVDSDSCRTLLYQLYTKCRDGFDQPRDSDLAECLENMLKSPGQPSIFIILDALDECPNNSGTPSPREKVLKFVDDLIGSGHVKNLFLCISSRPEQDIQSFLNPLLSHQVSLHDEAGQRDDIKRYLRSFVKTDRVIRGWEKEDKEFVVNTLSEKANGM
jgi:hypothetical protein